MCEGVHPQVSWCRLEVELSTPKAINAKDPSLANREPPPLVVAALSLKTHLPAQASPPLLVQ